MSDIVERLRGDKGGPIYDAESQLEAADEIERLRDDNKQLQSVMGSYETLSRRDKSEIERLRAQWESRADLSAEIERLRAQLAQRSPVYPKPGTLSADGLHVWHENLGWRPKSE